MNFITSYPVNINNKAIFHQLDINLESSPRLRATKFSLHLEFLNYKINLNTFKTKQETFVLKKN